MTRDDIIRMAGECQLVTTANRDGIYMEALERFAELVAANETALLQQLLALCSKDGGWTLEEAADTICEIENILRARLEGEQ